MATKIDWADETWNPITGCTPISEGCQNCYAKRMANRLRGRFGYPDDEPFSVTFHIEKLNKPLKWKKPRKIFVCSMGDLFHDDVETWELDRIFDRVLYDGISHHTWMILTKRPRRMMGYFQYLDDMQSSFDNVWLGVTAENQKRADERIPILLQIPAAVRFVSVEPMLGPINLRWVMYAHEATGETYRQYLERKGSYNQYEALRQLDWVIAGPETGPGARECKPEWIESLYEQCRAAGVPFFDKRKDYLVREFPR